MIIQSENIKQIKYGKAVRAAANAKKVIPNESKFLFIDFKTKLAKQEIKQYLYIFIYFWQRFYK